MALQRSHVKACIPVDVLGNVSAGTKMNMHPSRATIAYVRKYTSNLFPTEADTTILVVSCLNKQVQREFSTLLQKHQKEKNLFLCLKFQEMHAI